MKNIFMRVSPLKLPSQCHDVRVRDRTLLCVLCRTRSIHHRYLVTDTQKNYVFATVKLISPHLIITYQLQSINQSINHSNVYIADISNKSTFSGATAKLVFNCKVDEKQFCNINVLSSVLVSVGERPSQRDVSSDVS